MNGAADAFSGGILGGAEGLADLEERFVFEVAEQDGGAVGVVEGVHGLVEERFDVRPVGACRIHGGEFAGDLFTALTTRFAADNVDGGAAGDLIEPRREDGIGREAARLASKVDEHGLGDFLGELRRADLAKRSGKDEVEVFRRTISLKASSACSWTYRASN